METSIDFDFDSYIKQYGMSFLSHAVSYYLKHTDKSIDDVFRLMASRTFCYDEFCRELMVNGSKKNQQLAREMLQQPHEMFQDIINECYGIVKRICFSMDMPYQGFSRGAS